VANLQQRHQSVAFPQRLEERGAVDVLGERFHKSFDCKKILFVLLRFSFCDLALAHRLPFQVARNRQSHGGWLPSGHKGSCMMLQKRYKRMLIDILEDDVHVLRMGDMEIWDGADLALFREALTQLIEKDRCRAIVVDMQYVKYIPSGFFGMLFDWTEKRDVTFALTTPQPNVQRMLWFQRFFVLNEQGLFDLQTDPATYDLPTPPLDLVLQNGE